MDDLPTHRPDEAPSDVQAVTGSAGSLVREVRVFDELDSTNRYAMDLVRSGPGNRVAVVARHQTAGRGRLGRRWQAPPGANLLLSVVVDDPVDEADAFLVGPALALAAIAVLGGLGVAAALKWPNDVIDADGSKLGGVLVESEELPDGRRALVAGIGVNVAWPGPGDHLDPEPDRDAPVAPTPPASLATHGIEVSPLDLVPGMLSEFAERAARLGPGGEPGVVYEELVERCVTIGRTVDVHRARDTVSGTATGIDAGGHLVVATDAGPVTVSTGDVVHVRGVDG